MFSYGIVLCELIALVEADPDHLPRTPNFGVDYLAFSNLLLDPQCPPDFLKLAFSCAQVEPSARPTTSTSGGRVETVLEALIKELRLCPNGHRNRNKRKVSAVISAAKGLIANDTKGNKGTIDKVLGRY